MYASKAPSDGSPGLKRTRIAFDRESLLSKAGNFKSIKNDKFHYVDGVWWPAHHVNIGQVFTVSEQGLLFKEQSFGIMFQQKLDPMSGQEIQHVSCNISPGSSRSVALVWHTKMAGKHLCNRQQQHNWQQHHWQQHHCQQQLPLQASQLHQCQVHNLQWLLQAWFLAKSQLLPQCQLQLQ